MDQSSSANPLPSQESRKRRNKSPPPVPDFIPKIPRERLILDLNDTVDLSDNQEVTSPFEASIQTLHLVTNELRNFEVQRTELDQSIEKALKQLNQIENTVADNHIDIFEKFIHSYFSVQKIDRSKFHYIFKCSLCQGHIGQSEVLERLCFASKICCVTMIKFCCLVCEMKIKYTTAGDLKPQCPFCNTKW
jgi:hypothetical protein